jgi:hypothetical protein
VSRRLVLALAACALAAAAFADVSPSPWPRRPRPAASRKILKTETDPASATGDGKVTVVDDAGKKTEFPVNAATRVMRDGKKVSFDTALIGDLVVLAKFDPKTKTLSVLELRSGTDKPAAAAPPSGRVLGEVAFADALKGELSVKLGAGRTRTFGIGEKTKIVREAEGKPAAEADFATVKVGDSVEVLSGDGKTADEIRVRAASR